MHNKINEKEILKMLAENKLTNSENNLQRIPYDFVLQLLDKIRNGSYREISFLDFNVIEKGAGISASKKKLWEYYTVSAIALFPHAAIDGGLTPDDAFDLSDTMLQKLEKTNSLSEMHEIILLSATLFAYMVHEKKVKDKNYLIEQTKNYISRNIFSKIYLKNIAAYVNVHPNYLSRCFSKHENIRISDYIMREKMQVACNLLRHSDRSIAEISQYLSIPSQSNFTNVFKKWIGITPQKYRNKYYSEVF